LNRIKHYEIVVLIGFNQYFDSPIVVNLNPGYNYI